MEQTSCLLFCNAAFGKLGSKQTLTDTLARFARMIARIAYKKGSAEAEP